MLQINISVKSELSFDWSNFADFKPLLYRKPGVYVIYAADEVLYVGVSKNLASRLSGHVRNAGGKDLRDATHCKVYITPDMPTADVLETYFINELKPRLNFAKAAYSEFVQEADDRLAEIEVMIGDLIDELYDMCGELYDIQSAESDCDYLGEELYLVREIKRKQARLRRLRLQASIYRRRGGDTGYEDRAQRFQRSTGVYSRVERYERAVAERA